jgi:hypothetical protein
MRSTIIWLEDNLTSVQKYTTFVIENMNVNLLQFSTVSQLTKYLNLLKENNSEILSNLLLILDVMATDCYTIPSPIELGENNKVFGTDNGIDAGLVFYEKYILEIGSQENPKFCPPVIFFSAKKVDNDIIKRLDIIKTYFSKSHKVSMDNCKIKWLTKGDDTIYRWIGDFIDN